MKARMTVSRTNKKEIKIQVKDNTSRIHVLEMSFTLESFAEMITGLAEVEGIVKYGDLINVGKTKIIEKRSCQIPEFLNYGSKRNELKKWLEETKQEPGWFLNSYIDSQNSIQYDKVNKCTMVNYYVYKYVDNEE